MQNRHRFLADFWLYGSRTAMDVALAEPLAMLLEYGLSAQRQMAVRTSRRQGHPKYAWHPVPAALTKHFNMGVWVWGAEDGTPNSSTVATVVAGGGAIVHGVHVCACGYEGKPDGYHWLRDCPHGPSDDVRAQAAAALRGLGDVLGTAEALPQRLLGAVDKAAAVLCERCRFPSQVEGAACETGVPVAGEVSPCVS